MTGRKKTTTRILSVVCAGALLFGLIGVDNYAGGTAASAAEADTSIVHEVNEAIDTKTEELFDSDVVYQLTDTVTADTEISVIVALDNKDTVYDAYSASGSSLAYGEYASSSAGIKAAHSVSRASNKLIKKLNRSGVKYSIGETYDTLLSGFEIIIKAGDYSKVAKAVPEATLIVGEEYEKCETEVVTNDVDVYDTGIFDSSKSQYQGDGVVVAVLDTGLDYTHSAFSAMPEVTSLTRDEVGTVVESGALTASSRTSGLTADDVYYNEKVPYMYDYADNDPDVFPINSEHGTHVTGIIAGQNNVITGVAPNAQIVSMKVFSDSADSAKTSWILAALEDCVALGVDVINMSLGTSCGFSREVDKDNVSSVYDRVEAAGISLVCAASNDYNATMGSDKNGSLGLTSNPDSGTVGAPSSYEAALSVASVSGVMTNYILYGDEIIYFNEATDSTATTRNFIDDLMTRMGIPDNDYGTYEVPYVVIPGLGRSSDYTAADPDYYKDKIVLVRRGTTTFEEKIRVAMSKGALGIIIYNNVSGTISMSIGQNADAAACSISQDDGEKLVAAGSGTVTVSRSQQAGPFMSDFSSWGPTSDLRIKPEITAHGGDIYSCVPGEGYDRLSGTSMAAPNQTGVTALIRQYVKDNPTKFGLGDPGTTDYNMAVTAALNQLMMSTADIIYNKNAIPYAVRKQGAGLVNLYDAQASDGYIVTYDRDDGTEMSKAKLELGDDMYNGSDGVYETMFTVKNISSVRTTYKVDALIQTEGVSTTYTGHGDTTVSQDGYALDGTTVSVTKTEGSGSHDGNEISVEAGKSLDVYVTITLSEEDKEYIEESFEYGMYVEGFITLEELEGSGSGVDINVPLLAFYGDWTEAPIFDEEYYDTNVDEINTGLNDDDKLMADAYATRVVGGLYDDYIAYLGSYYFVQDPSMTQIAASKDHIALSNQTSSSSYTVNNLAYVYAGLLRNVGEIDVTITEDATGKVIYTDEVYNQRKSYGSSTIYASAVDMENFSAAENNLKNNTQYTVTLTAYLDYTDKDNQSNVRNEFSFPLYIDYEAPVVTGAEFRKETDQNTKETRLYVDLDIYDNHYAMAAQLGNVVKYEGDENYTFSIKSFGKYATPVYSSFNSTSKVTFELTDYIDEIKNSETLEYHTDGTSEEVENSNTFIVICYDYALNQSIYEIRIPDEIITMYLITDEDDGASKITNENTFDDPDYRVTLALNETLDLAQFIAVYPDSAWVQAFDYEIAEEDEGYVRVVNQTVLALAYTDEPVVLTITANTSDGTKTLELKITVSGNKGYTLPVVNSFSITDYYVEKAFYAMSSDDREIGLTGYTYDFGDDTTLSMFPSESVTINYDLQTYFPDDTKVVFSVGNSDIVHVDDDEESGTIVAWSEGSTTVTATVYYSSDGGETWRSQRTDRISVTVKDPFTTNSIYLMSYKGLGGTVEIPDDRGITTIYQYAFSNYEYVEKDLNNGDVIDEEDPYNTKPWFIGEDTITEMIIPEGVKEIQGYAFAGLESLEKVVFPSTLTRIGYGAFYGCTSLKTIQFGEDGKGDNNIQFINESAFYGCTKLDSFDFSSVVGIGKYAFYGSALYSVELPRTCQTLGYAAFANCSEMSKLTVNADSVKLDSYVFAYCTSLTSVKINASVIPSYAFYGCTSLSQIELGMDVSVINENAFVGTKISSFTVNPFNPYITVGSDYKEIYSKDSATLYAVVPTLTDKVTLDDTVKTISTGAFAGTGVTEVKGDGVTRVLSYAFAGCENLASVSFNGLKEIGDYAFYKTALTEIPGMGNGTNTLVIGEGAFAYTEVYGGDDEKLEVPANAVIGDYAFYGSSVHEVSVGDGAKIGYAAFAYCYNLSSVTTGKNVEIGDYAFYGYLAPDYESWLAIYGENDYSDEYYSHEYDYYTKYIQSETAYDKAGYTVYDLDGNDTGENASGLIYTIYTADLYVYNFTKAYTGKLTTVKIGDGNAIGDHAFADNTKLSSLTLGDGGGDKIDIGDYAFYNCFGLNGALNFGNVRSVGAYAFSVTREVVDVMNAVGSYAYYYGGLNPAYNVVSIPAGEDENGEPVTKIMVYGYRYHTYNGNLSGVLNLSGVKYIGEYAFAYNPDITGVTFGDGLNEIGAYAFYCCGIDSEDYSELDLSGVYTVGAYAFAGNTKLTEVILPVETVDEDGNEIFRYIGDGAFYGCSSLTTVTNLEYAQYIGAYAFAGTAIESINLSSAQYVGDFAFADIASEGVIEVIFFGEGGVSVLGELGENPFRGTDVIFVGILKEDEAPSYGDTFDVSGAVFVSDGVLYQQVNNGYVLVSYPLGKTNATYTLEDGTVRISASAFQGNTYIKNVVMSSELAAIGDKAFYECESLAMVVFTSYYAPALEEEYDETYQLYSNLAMSGIYGGFEGLGIVDYYMWSVGPNNYFYGATFVDYVGKVENKIVMVAPVNGQQYDSFIFSQYFDTVVYGAASASPATLKLISDIDKKLSGTITLEDENTINELLNSYNLLTPEQQALVTNYDKLSSAYQTLRFLQLEAEESSAGDVFTDEEKTDGAFVTFMKDNYIGLIIALIFLILFVVTLTFMIVSERRSSKASDGAAEGGSEGDDKTPGSEE